MIKTLDPTRSASILANNYIGYISYISQNRPFTIPITYFYNVKENYIICYSGNGHKINAMRKQPSVSLSVSEVESNNKWQSAMAQGTYTEIDGLSAKFYLHEFSLGIKDLILKKEHKDLDFISEFSSKIYNMELPIVFLIKVDELFGKKRS